jgi:two-component system sensor histidine kinase DesK
VSTITATDRPRPDLRARLFHRGAYQWYAGTIFGLAYQTVEVVNIWSSGLTLGNEIVGTVLLAIFYVAYITLPPIVWPESLRTKIIALVAYWAASFVLVPFVGVYVIWVWPLLIAMIAFCWMPARPSFILSGGIVVAQLIGGALVDFSNGTLYSPIVTATVFVSLFGITRQIMANQQLRDAQATIASLAAAEERARLARDLHDVLGHSLTVVAVKSELAGRLVDLDPARAKAEIGDIEALARTALADLRAAVTSYREMNLDSELSAARTALTAAGIEPHLPQSGASVNEELRSLFGWVVREGVTNVIRHSAAKSCWIELQPTELRVRDDGLGQSGRNPWGKSHGNGLRGLRERALEAGAEVSVNPGPGGGFVLTVAKATA